MKDENQCSNPHLVPVGKSKEPSKLSSENYLTALWLIHLEHLVLSRRAKEIGCKIQLNSQEDSSGIGDQRDTLETSRLVLFQSHVFGGR